MQLTCFDLDHTLITDNCSKRFGIYLYRQKLLSIKQLFMFAGYYSLHYYNFISLLNLHKKVCNKLFQGMDIRKINEHVKCFWDQSNFINPLVMAKLLEAKKKGMYTVILSSSPDFIVNPIAKALGVNEAMGTEYVIDDEFKIKTVNRAFDGKAKAIYVSHLAKKLNISKKNISAFSDSYYDLPFLSSAGNVTVVNPDKKLLKISQQNNWQTI